MASTKEYGWKGWKMPILHLDDSEYCEYGCPICTNARKGHQVAQKVQKVEMAIFSGGCWWGKAREKKYGVKPNEPLPSETK
ncbi:MAG: hypothetical protein GY770_32295 [Aestuariibacter sp.]|nr:hypothetical protein [Aestuariibacter sp.]